MINNPESRYPLPQVGLKDFLAFGITILSIIGVVALAIAAVLLKPDNVNSALAAVLPLFGSWVGTVLAYYFSKDNFESANISLSNMVDKITPQDKLKSTPVTDKMIAKSKIFYKNATDVSQTKLVDILQKFNESNDVWSRLPILDDQGRLQYIVHRTLIDKFLVDKLWNPDPTAPKTVDQFTIEDLLQDPKFQKRSETSFGMVSQDSTLADVKDVMDSLPDCKDVFVTQTGKPDEPILGWITNAILIENAKV
jgi:hypothetical protein